VASKKRKVVWGVGVGERAFVRSAGVVGRQDHVGAPVPEDVLEA